MSRIFVDMDGVLSDFSKKYKELYLFSPDEDYLSNNKDSNHQKFFDDFVKSGYFFELDPMEDIQIGLNFLEKLRSKYSIFILSSTAKESYFEQLSNDKNKWLVKYNIEYLPIFVPGKRFKKIYSKPGDILIDDTKKNIDDWVEFGGIGIHHNSWENSIKQLSVIL